jgi:protein N-terminal methyltransferase
MRHSIGRVTEGVLLNVAETVDIVEPIAKFSDNIKGKEGVGRIWNVGLEKWDFGGDESMKYDLIWHQWCLGHLTDRQLVEYLIKCSKALREGGFIVVKENLSTGEGDNFDEVDNTVTRSVPLPILETLSIYPICQDPS